jgi:Helix-turn-helix domain
MSLTLPEKRAAITALRGVKSQFNACVKRCLTIRHFYLVQQTGEYLPSAIQGAIKDFGGHWQHCFALQSHHESFFEGSWIGWHFVGPNPPLFWESRIAGKASCIKRFDALSEIAGNLLASLQIAVPVPPEIRAMARDCSIPDEMPLIPREPQRWATFLHWLAWSGGPLAVDRQTWDAGLLFSYDRAQDIARPFNVNVSGPPRFSFDTTDHPYNHFYSIIDNLFVRSSAALQWIISTLNDKQDDARIGGSGQLSVTKRSGWLKVSDAARTAGCNTGTISRAANKGELKSNGEKGRKRRIDSIDLNRWNLARLAKPEPTESAERVKRLVNRDCR